MGNKQNNIHKKKKRKYHSRSQKTGLPPGTLVYVGTARDERASLEIAQYTRDSFETNQMDTFEKCLPYFSEANRDESSQITTWLNVIGLHDTNLIQQIGTHFAIHPLVLEDIVNTGQRPKGEEFEGYFFLTSRMAYLASDTKEPTIEQVSFLLFSNMLITFQEQSQDVFEPIRERLQQGKGKIRSSGADFLFYSMLDALVDNYFDVLDVTGGELEEMEDHLLASSPEFDIYRMHIQKKNLLRLQKAIWPLRDAIQVTVRNEAQVFSKKNLLFMRDVVDHVHQVVESIHSYREIIAALTDMHLTAISNRTNEVMKVLTIMASLFIPLSFVAGLYGMNFRFMPELQWQYGYPLALTVMAVIAVSMLWFFRRKGWI